MIFRIPKGKHRARPLRFGIWWRRMTFRWQVTFTDSCRYDLGTINQLDINKLVGIGYLPSHHTDSARFGWRYWVGKDEIELLAYCYVNGDRVSKHLAYLKIGIAYNIEVYISKWAYIFLVDDAKGNEISDCEIQHNHKNGWQYRLGAFFGGNVTAPHSITIQLQKNER